MSLTSVTLRLRAIYASSLTLCILCHRWQHAATRVEEIRRLLVLAEEESDRAETESEALYYHQYDVVLAEPPRNKVCAVC